MRLSEEYYILQCKVFKSISEYLTHIKVLEDKIDVIKVTLDADNRTTLCLMMSLSQKYQYLVQIWVVISSITVEKARQMELEASHQHNQALYNSDDPAITLRHSSQAMKAGFQGKKEKERCDHCESTGHASEKCWIEHPELVSNWFKEKMKEQAKNKGRPSARLAQQFQVKSS